MKVLSQLGAKAITVDPRVYEVLWTLSAAAAINLLTGTADASSHKAPRISMGLLLLVLGIFLFLIGQYAREVREYALRLQVEARRGRLRDHIGTAIKAPGYSDLAISSGRWLLLAILDFILLMIVWLTMVL